MRFRLTAHAKSNHIAAGKSIVEATWAGVLCCAVLCCAACAVTLYDARPRWRISVSVAADVQWRVGCVVAVLCLCFGCCRICIKYEVPCALGPRFVVEAKLYVSCAKCCAW